MNNTCWSTISLITLSITLSLTLPLTAAANTDQAEQKQSEEKTQVAEEKQQDQSSEEAQIQQPRQPAARFDPSEEVSRDLSVSFPVDI